MLLISITRFFLRLTLTTGRPLPLSDKYFRYGHTLPVLKRVGKGSSQACKVLARCWQCYKSARVEVIMKIEV